MNRDLNRAAKHLISLGDSIFIVDDSESTPPTTPSESSDYKLGIPNYHEEKTNKIGKLNMDAANIKIIKNLITEMVLKVNLKSFPVNNNNLLL